MNVIEQERDRRLGCEVGDEPVQPMQDPKPRVRARCRREVRLEHGRPRERRGPREQAVLPGGAAARTVSSRS